MVGWRCAPCSPSGDCPGSLQCVQGVCVAGGDGSVDACPVTSCAGDQVMNCTGAHACPFGCATSGAPHCLALAPSNGITPALLDGATAVVDGADLEFDTATGEIQDGNDTVIRPAGAPGAGGQTIAVAATFSPAVSSSQAALE